MQTGKYIKRSRFSFVGWQGPVNPWLADAFRMQKVNICGALKINGVNIMYGFILYAICVVHQNSNQINKM